MNVHKFDVRRLNDFRKNFYIWLIVTIAVLLLTIGLLFIMTSIKKDFIEDLKYTEELLTKEVAILDRLKKEEQALQELRGGTEKKLIKVNKLAAITRNSPYDFLIEIAAMIPDTVTLTSFMFDTKKIEIEGLADEVQGITHFMRLLAQSKLLKMPKLASMKRNGRDVIFTVQVFKA